MLVYVIDHAENTHIVEVALITAMGATVTVKAVDGTMIPIHFANESAAHDAVEALSCQMGLREDYLAQMSSDAGALTSDIERAMKSHHTTPTSIPNLVCSNWE